MQLAVLTTSPRPRRQSSLCDQNMLNANATYDMQSVCTPCDVAKLSAHFALTQYKPMNSLSGAAAAA